eukprot:COSAG05_NODE_298_length_11929_cov_43.811496_4_plen_61_part_00
MVSAAIQKWPPLWIKDLSVARHQAWRSAGKVVMLRIHEIILDHIVIGIGQRADRANRKIE